MKEILSPSNLFEANELYQAVMGTNPNGIFIYDLNGNLLDCNEAACKMHEMDKEEILKLAPRDFIHPDGYETFKKFQHELKTIGEFTGESSGLTKSGRKFDVEVYGKLVHIRNKSYLYSTVKDIHTN